MRGSPFGAMVVASSLMIVGPALAQAPSPKPAAKPPATAAKPAPAPPAATPGAALDIKGFRSATFGMTPAQVKAAITADFGAGAMLQEGVNAAEGTQFIQATVDHLDPGPGPARIGYVFGATSKVLAIINVDWSTGPEPTEEQRAAIAQAGVQLAAYFRQGPAPAKAVDVRATGANALQLYAALDSKNAGVGVWIDGVSYKSSGGDKTTTSPPPKGPSTLRVTYSLNATNPDVKTLKPGSF
jgi:hypothetical protein